MNFIRHINSIIQSDCSTSFVNIGTQFYSIRSEKIQGQLSNGAYIFRGFSSSSFVVEGRLTFNIDVKHGIFIHESLVNKALTICKKREPRMLSHNQQIISSDNYKKLAVGLKGVSVMLNCAKNKEDLSMKVTEVLGPNKFAENIKQINHNITVDRYVYKEFGVQLKRDTKFLPVVKVGDILFPMELLDVIPTKKAPIQGEDQPKCIQSASIVADKRMEITNKMVSMKEDNSSIMQSYKVDAKPAWRGQMLDDQTGLEVAQQEQLKMRILPTPTVTKENGEDIPIINTKVQFKNFHECPEIGTFGIIIVANNLTERAFINFEHHIRKEFDKKFSNNEASKTYNGNCMGTEDIHNLLTNNDHTKPTCISDIFRLAIRTLDEKSRKATGKCLQWVMPILPDHDFHQYESIKAICDEEGENGLVSHCVKKSTINRMSFSMAENIIFKLNIKLGGIAYRIHPHQIWKPMAALSDSKTIVPGMC